jgi:hypothetical protein
MSAEFIDISTQQYAADIVWQGPGWYAPRSHYGSDRQSFTRFYRVGVEGDRKPDTYGMGLGTPEWFDQPTA